MTEQKFIKAVAEAISNANGCAQAALNTYELCCKAAEAWGMKPEIEVGIKKPGEPRHHSDVDCWCVTFEAGPYEWAVAASLNVSTKGKVLAEPYYSFDLCFSEV
jgi:pyrroloquinoline quinone (PQQ) biosynthesis protein C